MSRPRRNHVFTQITPTYARIARRRAPECAAFHRTALRSRQSRLGGINALKHGRYALPENLRLARLRGMALGEDREELQYLKQVPITAAKLRP